jgi:hypothetical protein
MFAEIPLDDVMPALGVQVPRTAAAFADAPLIASWFRKAQAGIPVTRDERNTLVAYLSWARDMVASPPVEGELVHAAVLDRNDQVRLAMGLRAFEGGDVVLTRPAGDAAAPAPPPAPAPRPCSCPLPPHGVRHAPLASCARPGSPVGAGAGALRSSSPARGAACGAGGGALRPSGDGADA